MPDNPGAWLVTTARHRAIDRLRRDRVLAAKLPLLAQPPAEAEDVMDGPPIPDERLELVFMCCHPALAIDAQVALTLRAVAGLTTEEIARAFLVPAETMKRRLTRAKSKIKVAGIPFGVPVASQLPERLAAVLAVVYLIFNEGYSGPGQPAESLASEAIRLGRVLAALLPAEPEVLGPGTCSTMPCWTRPCSRPRPRAARTPCRPRSPPSRRKRPSTGRRSPRSTASSPTGPARTWSG
jgi:RNA polymerase sigma-70 factor (ECF subfamily)